MIDRSTRVRCELALDGLRVLLASRWRLQHVVSIREDVFGSTPQQRVRIAMPRRESAGSILVYFLHGGGWHRGAPWMFDYVADTLAGAGLAVALGGYRLAPEHVFPSQLDDVASGLATAVESLRSAGRSVDGVIMSGLSAGGHLAALYALGSRGSIDFQLPVRGLLTVSAPLSLRGPSSRAGTRAVQRLLGPAGSLSDADPLSVLMKDCEQVGFPCCVVHGKWDPLVASESTALFVSALRSRSRCEVLSVAAPWTVHSESLRLFRRGACAREQSAVLTWMHGVVTPDNQVCRYPGQTPPRHPALARAHRPAQVPRARHATQPSGVVG